MIPATISDLEEINDFINESQLPITLTKEELFAVTNKKYNNFIIEVNILNSGKITSYYRDSERGRVLIRYEEFTLPKEKLDFSFDN